MDYILSKVKHLLKVKLGAGEGDRVYAIFMLFGPFLPLFSIKNI